MAQGGRELPIPRQQEHFVAVRHLTQGIHGQKLVGIAQRLPRRARGHQVSQQAAQQAHSFLLGLLLLEQAPLFKTAVITQAEPGQERTTVQGHGRF